LAGKARSPAWPSASSRCRAAGRYGGPLIVTGVFASALGYSIQVWAQQRISATRIALVLSLETVWAGFFGYVLDGDRLGLVGLTGCALIFLAILVAEPAAARTLRRLVSPRSARGRAPA
jgi:drug/metabolite transporter (DMT)-like permease